MFDTNVYISFIRNHSHRDKLQQPGTIKHISAIVLMELWAGARTRKAERILRQLQSPYENANRIVILNIENYITAGNIISDLPAKYYELCRRADFINDIQIALSALSIGATLYTENVKHFNIIKSNLKQLKVEYLMPLNTGA